MPLNSIRYKGISTKTLVTKELQDLLNLYFINCKMIKHFFDRVFMPISKMMVNIIFTAVKGREIALGRKH